MAKSIKRCVACLGSGKILPECEPWNRFPGGSCPMCDGNGYPDTVRLKKLCAGDLFQTINGREFLISRKDKDGCVAVDQTDNSQEYWPHDPAVRILRRADMAFFVEK